MRDFCEHSNAVCDNCKFPQLVREVADRIEGADLSRPRQDRTAGSVDERRWQRERLRVLTTQAWHQWNDSHNPAVITPEAAADLYRVDRYVLGRAREMKVNRLREMFADDSELTPFLDAAAIVLLSKGEDDGNHPK